MEDTEQDLFKDKSDSKSEETEQFHGVNISMFCLHAHCQLAAFLLTYHYVYSVLLLSVLSWFLFMVNSYRLTWRHRPCQQC